MAAASEAQVKFGVTKIQSLVKGYLLGKDDTTEVNHYLSKVILDEETLASYLISRKFNAESAFEKLKGMAELRFKIHPEVFPREIPQLAISLQERGIIGAFKVRDHLGRRVVYFNAAEWDTKEFDLDDITRIGVICLDNLLRDADAMKNGVIYIQNCDKMGFNHAKFHTLYAMRRIVNIFLAAGPIRVKGLYFINLPFILVFLPELIRPFFPKKMKERFHVSGHAKGWEDIHKLIPPEQLPKFLGGPLDNADASDQKFREFICPKFY